MKNGDFPYVKLPEGILPSLSFNPTLEQSLPSAQSTGVRWHNSSQNRSETPMIQDIFWGLHRRQVECRAENITCFGSPKTLAPKKCSYSLFHNIYIYICVCV